ncbi:N-acetylmuramoyl-L-alanine amidase [Rhodococcus kronopolitis]|uniref:N-acetylmuramoyl-L-alanine amidase n=1 Tax=Rhodococcus kronopolitis TaxID=1460226 RepID=A0ABV9FK82_9NOCA
MKKSTLTAALAATALTAMLVPAVAVAAPEAEQPTPLTGKTVFLDPGHQGAGHSENLARQVDDGRGGTKDCQTTGMTSLGGVPEHTITWNVSELVKSSLETLGAKVVLSRADDTGWGGCVDERAKAANASGADLAVSVHADSTAAGADAADHGFHMIVPTLPVPDSTVDAVQSTSGLEASKLMRDAYVKNGFTPANYAGVVDGLQSRADIAGPALTTVPLVFVEMGNGSNPDDAAVLDTQDGQLKHAIAIITGAVNYLMDTPVAATEPSTAEPATPPTAKSVTPSTTKPTTPPTTKPATPESGDLVGGLATLGKLLDVVGLGGLQDFVTAENVGVLSGLIGKLLGILNAGAGQG